MIYFNAIQKSPMRKPRRFNLTSLDYSYGGGSLEIEKAPNGDYVDFYNIEKLIKETEEDIIEALAHCNAETFGVMKAAIITALARLSSALEE